MITDPHPMPLAAILTPSRLAAMESYLKWRQALLSSAERAAMDAAERTPETGWDAEPDTDHDKRQGAEL